MRVDEWRATEYGFDESRKFSNILSIILGNEKKKHTIAVAKRLQVSREKIIAFSDSICDLPLLLIAGEVFAVNPDYRLKTLCKRKGWQII